MFTPSTKWKIGRFSNKQICDSLIKREIEREKLPSFFNSKKGFYFLLEVNNMLIWEG